MSTATRILLAVALVTAIHVCGRFAGTVGMPTQASIPAGDFHEVPLQLGTWSGEDARLDPGLANLGGSYATVNRIYRSPAGAEIIFYAALFDQVEIPVSPHPPEACYTASGHRIVTSRDLHISAGKESAFLARILTLERDGSSPSVLFWYQIPGVTYLDGRAQRRLFWTYRGQTTWPAVVKVMLESRNPNADKAADELKDLAGHTYQWVKQYQETEQESPLRLRGAVAGPESSF